MFAGCDWLRMSAGFRRSTSEESPAFQIHLQHHSARYPAASPPEHQNKTGPPLSWWQWTQQDRSSTELMTFKQENWTDFTFFLVQYGFRSDHLHFFGVFFPKSKAKCAGNCHLCLVTSFGTYVVAQSHEIMTFKPVSLSIPKYQTDSECLDIRPSPGKRPWNGVVSFPEPIPHHTIT